MIENKKGYVLVECQCCQTPFQARVADRKRGWAKFCSKSCKAIEQERRTGQYARYRGHLKSLSTTNVDYEGSGWDAHKNIF